MTNETLARTLFSVFSDSANLTVPWEHLSNNQQAGWLEVVRFVQSEIEEQVDMEVESRQDAELRCPGCDEYLTCAACDGKTKPAEVVTSAKNGGTD